jgi:hypothetical protein
VSGADLVLVVLPDAEEGRLTVEVAERARPELAGVVVSTTKGALATALNEGRAVLVDDLGVAAAWPPPIRVRSGQLSADGTARGLLVIAQPSDLSSATRST